MPLPIAPRCAAAALVALALAHCDCDPHASGDAALLDAGPEFDATGQDAVSGDALTSDVATADSAQRDGATVDGWLPDGAVASDAGPGVTRYADPQIGAASCADYDPAQRACSSGSATAFQTLAGAATAAGPGTTVLIRGATYAEPLQPASSGTPQQPIVFRGYSGEVGTISGASLSPAIDLSNRQYIVIENLVVSDVQRWLHALDASHNTIRNCTFRRALDSGGSSKTGLFFQDATLNRIEGNTIEDSTQDNLSLVRSDRNLIVGNTLRRAAHTLWTIKCGNQNILRGNSFNNEVQKIGEIYDCDGVGFDHDITAVNATRRNLVEGNTFEYTPSSGDSSPYAGIQYAGQDGIIRRNVFHSTVGPGLSLTLYGGEAAYNTGNRIYHNVFYRSDFAGIEIAGAGYSFGDNVIRNNALVRSQFVANDTRWSWYTTELAGQPVQIMLGRLDGLTIDHNCIFNRAVDELYLIAYGSRTSTSNPPAQTVSWWQTDQPALFSANLEVEPAFDDEANHRFTLGASSPLIDAGAFLTTTSAGGSGTLLAVTDARFFADGFGIAGESGDLIQLEGQASSARVVGVDLGANTLTLDQPLSWSAGVGVAQRYTGLRPDVGAFERE